MFSVVLSAVLAGSVLSGGFAAPEVSVGGAPLKVEQARCSAMPVNIRWPGHQRELDQTEICHFVRFDFTGPVEMRVKSPRKFTKAMIRPISKNVSFLRQGDEIVFTIREAGAYSVEFEDRHNNLHVFADEPGDYSGIDRKAPNVRYFGPGEHEVGLNELKTGETLFIDDGATVHGRVFARDADHIRILGRGILDCGKLKEVPVEIDPKLAEEQRKKGFAITNVDRFDAVRLEFCDDVKIEGCTVWNDWGHALEIGAETRGKEISNVVFRNCDVIRHTASPLNVKNADQALVKDIVHENIRLNGKDVTEEFRAKAAYNEFASPDAISGEKQGKGA